MQALHWHGYGPWTGQPLQREDEKHRRSAGPQADNAALPPMQLGEYLTRRRATSADRTWTNVDEALDWLAKRAAEHPPYGSYVSAEDSRGRDREQLHGGSDVYRQYYTGTSSMTAFAVVCCPHAHLLVPCPLPPS